jgi:GT2 family glycosyltransferase
VNKLPSIDIVIASYNSEKWIDSCIDSIVNCSYPKECINVYVCDNASTDQTVKLTEAALVKAQLNHKVLSLKDNLGFGIANNKAAALGNSPYIFCLNFDTELGKDTLNKWADYVAQNDSEKVATFEFCQVPYEHPKLYNPATLNTTWNSAAALMIKRHVFEAVGGFDKKIFMYCEDVDLSWRIRSKGYVLKYLHFCKVEHHSYTNHYGNSLKVVNSIIYNLLLRYRYGGVRTVLKGYIQLMLVFFNNQFGGSKKELLKKFIKHFAKAPYFLRTRVKLKHPQFYYWDFEAHRYGYAANPPENPNKPLVSIIVRTHNRPNILKEAIQSIMHQDYTNWELIIAEDAGETAKEVVEYFNDDRITYIPSLERIGRSATGNRALAASKGELLNFLDDDDFFYPDHLSTLVNHHLLTKSDASYTIGLEALTSYDENRPNHYRIERYNMPLFTEYSRFTMATMNFLPIQTVLFSRKLYEKYGGFDESLEYLEDWDFWYRYSINNDFRFYPKATSIYKVPYDQEMAVDRQKKLDENLRQIRSKYQQRNIDLFGSNPEVQIDAAHRYMVSRFSLFAFLSYKRQNASFKGKMLYGPLVFLVKCGQKLKKVIA